MKGATDESQINCYTWERLVKDFAIRDELSRNAVDMFVSMDEYYASRRFVSSNIENSVDEVMDLSTVGQRTEMQR